jgi:hypothetical protein
MHQTGDQPMAMHSDTGGNPALCNFKKSGRMKG